MLEFKPYPKIGRMTAMATISEKIDGTNAQIQFDENGNILVGSRKRAIYPEGTLFTRDTHEVIKGTDNFGFAYWAYTNREQLFDFLGEGTHYGEWAGQGIQRGYDLVRKRFFMFNTLRFGEGRQEIPTELFYIGLDVVPVVHEGPYSDAVVDDVMRDLKRDGSAINGYNPEGVVVYHHGLKTYHKETFEYSKGKWSTE